MAMATTPIMPTPVSVPCTSHRPVIDDAPRDEDEARDDQENGPVPAGMLVDMVVVTRTHTLPHQHTRAAPCAHVDTWAAHQKVAAF